MELTACVSWYQDVKTAEQPSSDLAVGGARVQDLAVLAHGEPAGRRSQSCVSEVLEAQERPGVSDPSRRGDVAGGASREGRPKCSERAINAEGMKLSVQVDVVQAEKCITARSRRAAVKRPLDAALPDVWNAARAFEG